MIRDTFFSQTRFVNLCRKEMVENWKSNLLRVALMYGAMAVIMLWSGYLSYRAVGQDTDSTWEFNLVIFMWGLCVFGCLSASFTMERMKSKTGRLSVLMTPATSFEKYFSRWLVFTVVFLIVFLITYKLADYTKVLVYSLVYPENNAIACFLILSRVKPGEEGSGSGNRNWDLTDFIVRKDQRRAFYRT